MTEFIKLRSLRFQSLEFTFFSRFFLDALILFSSTAKKYGCKDFFLSIYKWLFFFNAQFFDLFECSFSFFAFFWKRPSVCVPFAVRWLNDCRLNPQNP